VIKGFHINFPKRKKWRDDENYFKEKKFKRKKLKKNMEENFLHPELKKLRIKDFQGNFSKKIWRETKNISRRKKII